MKKLSYKFNKTKLPFKYMTLLIAQITDTHIVSTNQNIYVNKDLLEVVSRINNLRPLPDFVIHTGDLVDKGDLSSYIKAKEIMDQLKVPYFITCGNHDDHSNLQKILNNLGLVMI